MYLDVNKRYYSEEAEENIGPVCNWPYVYGVSSDEYPILLDKMTNLFADLKQTYGANSLNDLGTGNGWLLPRAKGFFSRVQAYDSDRRAVQYLRSFYGNDVRMLPITPNTVSVASRADVLVLNHLLYYTSKHQWTHLLKSATADGRRKYVVLTLWSQHCEAYRVGSLKSGRRLPCAEDLYHVISRTGGTLIREKTVEAQHYLHTGSFENFEDFLSLDAAPIGQSPLHQNENGRCVEFAGYQEFDLSRSAVVRTIAQRDLILVAEYPAYVTAR